MEMWQSLPFRDTDRIVVTGASGWLGRELIHRLRTISPQSPILALGSRAGELFAGTTAATPVHQWSSYEVAAWNPTLAVHLAYLTKERLETVEVDRYVAANACLTDAALGLYAIPTMRGVVVASSGAAIRYPNDIYGRLKALDETAFANEGVRLAIPTVVARAWSLSGRFCTKPQRFLLYDLITQALGPNSDIAISASHPVLRKYVDAGEYLAVCLAAVATGWSGTVDSTGTVIEAGQLVEAIQAVLGTHKPTQRLSVQGRPDDYYSDSTILDEWATKLGLSQAQLSEQIARSSIALTD